jgi:peroxisome-assembly ATPase
VNAIFKVLCSEENDVVRRKTFTHFGRNIEFEKTCGQVLYTTFNELCDRPLGASDYVQMAQYFHTIIIKDVPQLNLKLKSQTRRFITLIDSLYDHRIRVRFYFFLHNLIGFKISKIIIYFNFIDRYFSRCSTKFSVF